MTMETRRIPLFAGGAALILIVAWYFLLFGPQSKSIQKAHKAHAAAELQIGQLQSQVGELQGWAKQIPADNAKFAQLETALPNNPQLDQALQLLHQAAVASGVNVTTLAPGAPAASSSGSSQQATGAPSVTLSMSVQGGMSQVKAFLAALQSLPRTVVVDQMTFSGSGGGSTNSTATISARIFYAGQPTP